MAIISICSEVVVGTLAKEPDSGWSEDIIRAPRVASGSTRFEDVNQGYILSPMYFPKNKAKVTSRECLSHGGRV